MRRHLLVCLLTVSLAGCSTRKPEVAEVAPPPALAPLPPAPMPLPPNRAAIGLTIPARLADGSYATPNRVTSPAASVWHLRAALNVAALGCPEPALSDGYNHLLVAHRKPLGAAHAALMREYGGADAFDVAMTRLYNYFAQPPAQAGFCVEAAAVMQEVQAVPPAELAGYATAALQRLDRPFTDFYAAYDRYRIELAAWRAGETPRLAYDLPALRRIDAGLPAPSLYADGTIASRKRL